MSVSVQELSSARVTVFSQTLDEDTGIATVVLRGPTRQILDDVERSINDAVNVAKLLCKNGGCVAGAGACEIELALALQAMGDECPGLEQYAIKKVRDTPLLLLPARRPTTMHRIHRGPSDPSVRQQP